MKARGKIVRTGLLLCCLLATLAVGCNTTRGVGQDTSALGRDIQRAAK